VFQTDRAITCVRSRSRTGSLAQHGIVGEERITRTLIGEGIDLAIDLETPLGLVYADPFTQRVLANLATNARDAMPNGGKLTIARHQGHDGTATTYIPNRV
jgi:signal transduction histidine kinase